MKKISIITPIFNESENIPILFKELGRIAKSIEDKYIFEYICINDGSTDSSLIALIHEKSIHKNLKIIDFSRNFGKEAALTAGIDFCEADALIPIDADLQHPPEKILEMINLWENGYDMVLAKRIYRNDKNIIKNIFSRNFYKLSKYIFEIEIENNVGDFRLIDRKIIESIKLMPEKSRFMKGIFSWPGFKKITINYEEKERKNGNSKFDLFKLARLAIDGITSFSTTPLRIATYIGSIISILSIIYGIYIFAKTIIYGIETPGYASLMIAILFSCGIQLIGIGILGEYIGKIYKEVKNRPVYLINKIY